eukprot:scaffold56577_cov37-Tisochrysis_lutea.AAC.10
MCATALLGVSSQWAVAQRCGWRSGTIPNSSFHRSGGWSAASDSETKVETISARALRAAPPCAGEE